MRKTLIIMGILLTAASLLAQEGKKIPDDAALSIRNIQYDIGQQQQRIGELQQQLQREASTASQQIQHDQAEIQTTIERVVKDAKLDPAKWTVDQGKLTFTEKKSPPPAK